MLVHFLKDLRIQIVSLERFIRKSLNWDFGLCFNFLGVKLYFYIFSIVILMGLPADLKNLKKT